MLDTNNRTFIKHAKKMFDPALLSSLRERFIDLEKMQSPASITDREKNALARGESSDNLRMQIAWYEVWKGGVENSDIQAEIEPYTYVTYPVQVRHVRESHHQVPWHQDIGYMRLLGDRGPRQVITCFIPLEMEPSRCTTIQFARDSHKHESNKEYPHVALDGFGAGIDDSSFQDCFHYELDLGDALIFGDHALHRTFLPENCQINRRSLEFRLILPSHAIAGRDYFDVKQKSFVKINEDKLVAESTVG